MTDNLLGYDIDIRDMDEISDELLASMKKEDHTEWIGCANTHSLAVADKDAVFKRALLSADILLPDGVGIIYASKLLGGKIRKRNAGPDLFSDMMRKMNQRGGYTCFFMGSTPATLATIKERAEIEYPNIQIVGMYSPPFVPEFSEQDNQAIIDIINQAKPDALWVGLTAPKQEKWVHQHVDQLDVKAIGCVGAAFDFFAGTKQRSSSFFRDRGMEWLPRFFREPKRMFGRIFISTPTFLKLILRERRGQRRKQG
jgi:N-acetylglucosaminyldiphosphoundecaprenol N-acetyl-beta-D-mannosaminyltransferase